MGVSKMISYHLVLLLSHLAQVYLQTTPDVSCCEWKSVKNSAESFLDGWYQLKEIKDDKPEDVCGDRCVYTQVPSDGYDYCFKDEASSSEVFCEAPPTDLPTIPGTTASLTDQAAQVNEALNTRNKELAEAEELGAETEKVKNKIDEITGGGGGSKTSRIKRQEQISSVPTDCPTFMVTLDAFNAAIGNNPRDANITKGLLIAQVLSSVDQGSITCNPDEVSSLLVMREVTVVTVATVVKEVVNIKKIEINVLIVQIQEINKNLSEAGFTTVPVAASTHAVSPTRPPPSTIETMAEETTVADVGGTGQVTGQEEATTGQYPVSMEGESTGQYPVSMEGESTGQYSVSMEGESTGQFPVSMEDETTGQYPIQVESASTGQYPITMEGGENEATGQYPVPVDGEVNETTGQYPVAIEEEATGQYPVSISGGLTGQQPVEVEGVSLSDQAAVASQKLNTKYLELADAEYLVEEIEKIATSIDAITEGGDTTIIARKRRQEEDPTIPSDCPTYINVLNDFSSAIGSNPRTANVTEGLLIAQTLSSVDPGVMRCSVEEVSSLKTLREVTVKTAKSVVMEVVNLKKIEINNLILMIQEINYNLSETGMSTVPIEGNTFAVSPTMEVPEEVENYTTEEYPGSGDGDTGGEATGQYPVPFLGQGNQTTGQFPVPFESNFTQKKL